MCLFKNRNKYFPGLPPEPEVQSPRECRSTGSASSDVMEPPLIEDLSPDNIHVLRGKKFQLKSKFQGEPPPTVTWLLQKTELKTGMFNICYPLRTWQNVWSYSVIASRIWTKYFSNTRDMAINFVCDKDCQSQFSTLRKMFSQTSSSDVLISNSGICLYFLYYPGRGPRYLCK